jgi:hypothetical protein
MSKWLDAVTHTGVYHMQQSHFQHMKPPTYYDNHDLNMLNLRRDREREHDLNDLDKFTKKKRAIDKSIQPVKKMQKNNMSSFRYDSNHGHSGLNGSSRSSDNGTGTGTGFRDLTISRTVTDRTYLMGEGRTDGGWGDMYGDGTSTFYNMNLPATWDAGNSKGFASTVGGRTHSLFLQELVHLASLCNAVAFSTLRNGTEEMEGTESPLDLYTPGSPWPEVDSDKVDRPFHYKFMDTLRYLLGFDRSFESRRRYNKMRPLAVLGGVSDNEIKFLQRARGPSAKMTLAWHWLSEFIIREHLSGSLGNVGPPIISRIFQFLSDGMIFYNHARKTMYIPFPFPHAQISAFFVFTIMFAVPLLMDEYANNIYLGALLTFLTVTCLAGLHEVARELENPFRNAPNEIPLCTLQAMFNESLVTLYSGYHPDQFWDGDEYRNKEKTVDTPATADSTSDSDKEKVRPQDPKVNNKTKMNNSKPVTFGQLQSVVAEQQKEISRLSALIEGGKDNGRCDTL